MPLPRTQRAFDRRALFKLVVALPAVAFVVWCVWLFTDLRRLESDRHDATLSSLQRTLAGKTGGTIVPREDLADLTSGDFNVLVYGGSSVALPPPIQGWQPPTFTGYLDQALDQREIPAAVVNLGIVGADSFTVSQHVEDTVAAAGAPPDLLVVYYGHNDYNNAYNNLVVPERFGCFHSLLRPAHLLSSLVPEGSAAEYGYKQYVREHRHSLARTSLRTGLSSIDDQEFTQYDAVVLEHFSLNTAKILDVGADRGIPVVLIKPVCNLRREPQGSRESTTDPFERGLATQDHGEAIDLLIQAKDGERFSYDIRAKTPLLDYLGSLEGDGVHVLDLLGRWRADGRQFGSEEFVDLIHFTDFGHRLVAEDLLQFLLDRDLLPETPPEG